MIEKIRAFFEREAPTRSVDLHKNVVLYLEDISVSFDGFKAIDSLNLYVMKNELRCIIGPNGAGKSTQLIFHNIQIKRINCLKAVKTNRNIF
jgi:ABC-type uncharacterized transport system ATPase subunit